MLKLKAQILLMYLRFIGYPAKSDATEHDTC